jgi:hypothetical protein
MITDSIISCARLFFSHKSVPRKKELTGLGLIYKAKGVKYLFRPFYLQGRAHSKLFGKDLPLGFVDEGRKRW